MNFFEMAKIGKKNKPSWWAEGLEKFKEERKKIFSEVG